MKRIYYFAVSLVLLIALKPESPALPIWELDKSNSNLGFSIERVVLSPVKGKIEKFTSKISTPKEDFSGGSVEVTADVRSITTGIVKRDNELRSPNYFDAEKYPEIIFKSTLFKKLSENNYEVMGNLTMHGVTKPFKLMAICTKSVNAASQRQVALFKISGKVNRSDFGIGKGTSSTLVSNTVSIFGTVEFSKPTEIR
jgi:polyisoprenoid-binding protein YceI